MYPLPFIQRTYPEVLLECSGSQLKVRGMRCHLRSKKLEALDKASLVLDHRLDAKEPPITSKVGGNDFEARCSPCPT